MKGLILHLKSNFEGLGDPSPPTEGLTKFPSNPRPLESSNPLLWFYFHGVFSATPFVCWD